MAKSSPTAKALKDLRSDGYECEKVEQRLPIPGRFVTRDLFGCIDLVAMKAGAPLLAVQVTSRSNVNARMTKSQQKARVWVSTGNRFEIIGYGPHGGKRTVVMGMDGNWFDREERQ